MAITATDLVSYLTGAATNGGAQADPDASLGGYRSSTEITSGTVNNLFDNISGAEALAGHTDYRCFVIRNEHATLSLTDAKVFVSTDDSNDDTTYSIAVERPATAGLTDGAAQTVANEGTAPTVNDTGHNGTGSGVSDWVLSSVADSYADGIGVDQGAADANLDPGELIFVWVKRVIGVAAEAASSVAITVTVQGDTEA